MNNITSIYEQARLGSDHTHVLSGGQNSGMLKYGTVTRHTIADDSEKLMGRIDKSYVPKTIPKQAYDDNMCPICGMKNVMMGDDRFVCLKCNIYMGQQTNHEMEAKISDKPQAHIKLKHFIPILNKLQGQMIKPITDTDMNHIIQIICKSVVNIKSINYKITQSILKNINRQSHYCNIPYIIRIIKNKPLFITNYQKMQMITMFQQMGDVYKKYTGQRVNSISYDYIAYKFCQILNIDGDILDNLRIIKDANTRYDPIWKCIVEEMGWEYYPTII